MNGLALRTLLLLVGCLGLALSPVGCGRASRSMSALSSKVGNREFRCQVDGPGFLHPTEKGILFTSERHQAELTANAILINGEELASLPADAALIEIRIFDGRLSVDADQQPIVSEHPLP